MISSPAFLPIVRGLEDQDLRDGLDMVLFIEIFASIPAVTATFVPGFA